MSEAEKKELIDGLVGSLNSIVKEAVETLKEAVESRL